MSQQAGMLSKPTAGERNANRDPSVARHTPDLRPGQTSVSLCNRNPSAAAASVADSRMQRPGARVERRLHSHRCTHRAHSSKAEGSMSAAPYAPHRRAPPACRCHAHSPPDFACPCPCAHRLSDSANRGPWRNLALPPAVVRGADICAGEDDSGDSFLVTTKDRTRECSRPAAMSADSDGARLLYFGAGPDSHRSFASRSAMSNLSTSMRPYLTSRSAQYAQPLAMQPTGPRME
jgi:hypothetical protein